MNITSTMRKMAIQMINEEGGDGVYISYLNGTYSPETGKVERAEVRTPIKLCLFELLRAGNGEKAINNTLTEIADKQAYISAKTYFNASVGVDRIELTLPDGEIKQYIVKVLKTHGCSVKDAIMYEVLLESC